MAVNEDTYAGIKWNDPPSQTRPVVLPITRPLLVDGSPLGCLRFLELEKKYLLDTEGYDSMECGGFRRFNRITIFNIRAYLNGNR